MDLSQRYKNVILQILKAEVRYMIGNFHMSQKYGERESRKSA